jgi:hypothetical protein
VDETGWVGLVGGDQGDVTGVVDSGRGAEVNRGGGVPADAGMAVDVVVLGEEPFQVLPCICQGGKGFREIM